jgi:glycosyltransferase involved in cell wall biosynthesis
MKHIALVTTSFPDDTPGAEAAGSFVADFAEALAEHTRVTVVAPALSRKEPEHRGNLSIVPFPVPFLPLSLLTPANPLNWLPILRVLRAGLGTLRTVIEINRIDHVFALWALPSGYWAREIWKQHGIPYSIWALGSDIWGLGTFPVVRRVLRSILRDSCLCFADGHLLQREVEHISGRNCQFLPSSRKLPSSPGKQLSSGPPYSLAFLGRWHRNKGIDLLMDSLKLLIDADWAKIREIRICGDGPLHSQTKGACLELQAAGRPVATQGYIGKREAAELLTWADYLLIPSRIESIPVVFSDAMQCSCPVIATPVGDMPRLIEEYHSGVVATAVSAPSFADAIRAMLGSSPSIFEKGLANAAHAFDTTLAARQFLDHLTSSSSAPLVQK